MTNSQKIIVLASGNGSNFQSIIDHVTSREINAEITALITDKEHAFARERAKKASIPDFFVDGVGKTREEFDLETETIIKKEGCDLIVLAGFMRILSKKFVKQFKNKIINIHPSLLPSFAGVHGYEDAWKYGVKVSGCTVHFVDEGMDTGPIILQKVNPIKEDDTLESFKERGLKIEHQALPEAIKLFFEGKLSVIGKKTRIKNDK